MTIPALTSLADIGEGEDVPLPNVTARILAKVIEYCTEHVKGTRSKEDQPGNVSKIDEELKTWDTEFCKVDQGTLFELILAANYLNMKSLLELTCQTVASMIKGKTPEEIRATFNIEKDFTTEEEEEVKRYVVVIEIYLWWNIFKKKLALVINFFISFSPPPTILQ